MDSESIFNNAKELLRDGKQKEAIYLFRKAASHNHFQSLQIVRHVDYLHELTKEYAINPLNIINNEEINKQHVIPNLSELYEKDILSNLARIQVLNNGLDPDKVTELLIYQTLDNLIEYKNKSLDILPLGVVLYIFEQIRTAFIRVYIDKDHGAQIIDNYEIQLMKRIWKPGIIEETLNFMDKLDNRYFMS